MAEGIELAKAYVQIVPSAKGIQGELDTALSGAGEKAGKTGGKGIAKGIGSAVGGIAKVTAAGIAATGAAATAAAGALINGASGLAEYGDAIDKQSQKLGISAEAYQEWDAVLQHSGTSIDALKAPMKTLFNAAQNGSDAFEKLGISQEAAASMSKEDLFGAVITQLQGMDDETEKAALAQELLGKGAQELGPLLNTSAEDTQAMKDRVHELGGVLSNEAVKNSATFQDNLQDMKTALSGVKNTILQEALPGMNQLMAGFTGLITGEDGASEAISQGMTTLLENIGGIVEKIGGLLKEIFPQLVNTVVENLPALLELGGDIFKGIIDGILAALPILLDQLPTMLQTFIDLFLEIAGGIIEALPDIVQAICEALPIILPQLIDGIVALIVLVCENFEEIIQPIIDNLPDILNSLIDAILRNLPILIKGLIQLVAGIIKAIPQILAALWQVIVHVWDEWMKPFLGNIGEVFKKAWEGLKDGARKAWEGIKQIFSGIAEWFRGIFRKAWEAVKKVFSAGGRVFEGIKEGITEAFKRVVNAIIRGINTVIAAPFNAINGIFDRLRGVSILKFTPFSWLPALAVPQIPELAEGGVLEAGRMALLEGSGAEAVVPLEKNTGWIRRVAEEMAAETAGKYRSQADDIAEAMEGLGIYLDGNILVGGIAARTDKSLGERTIMAGRMVAQA